MQALRDQSAQRRAEADREIKRRERLEREMKELVCTARASGIAVSPILPILLHRLALIAAMWFAEPAL